MTWLLLLLVWMPIQDEEPDLHAQLANKRVSLIVWWDNAELCTSFGIAETQRVLLAKELNNMMISYQLAQTKLKEARTKQTEMFKDTNSTEKVLTDFNQSEIVVPTEQMQALNFKARLRVRSQLNKQQIEQILAKVPNFFNGRWFKANKNVRQGNVVVKK